MPSQPDWVEPQKAGPVRVLKVKKPLYIVNSALLPYSEICSLHCRAVHPRKRGYILCRCEQVTLGQVRETISYGTQTVTDVKNISRTGMGNCQGRTCGSIIAQILAAETGRSVEDVRYYNIRPPVHPVPLGVIEEHESEVA